MDKQESKILFDKILDVIGSFEIDDLDEPYFIARQTVWYSYPMMIKWKISERNKMDSDKQHSLIFGINTSLIVDCASFVEGVIDEVLRKVLYHRQYPAKDELKYRLITDLENRLENAQWTEYIKVSELIIGKTMSNSLGNDLWKSISTMFVFRNMIVHGKELQIEYYKDSKEKIRVVVPRKYNTVYGYLIEKRVIIKKIKDRYDRIDIIDNLVIDHFFKISIQFLLKYVKLFNKKERENIETRIVEAINLTE